MPAVPCPSCKRPINAVFSTCPFCGGSVRPAPAAAAVAPPPPPPVNAKVLPCPSCARPINAAFTTCPFCKATVTRAPGRAPLSRDYAAFAERACVNLRPEWSFDVSAASAMQLEFLLASEFGTAGAMRDESAEWPPDPRVTEMLFGLGCLFGEIVKKTFGGEWVEEVDPKNPFASGVKLPDGTVIMAAARPYKRARFGAENSVWDMYQTLLGRFRPIPDHREVQGFLRVAAHLESRGLAGPAFQVISELSKRKLPPALASDVRTFEHRLLPKLRQELAAMAAPAMQAEQAPARRTPEQDWAEFHGDLFFGVNGIRTALVPSSLAALDAWISGRFGPDPVPEAVREEEQNVRFERMIGAWLGRYFIEVLGGTWAPEDDTRIWHVTWPGGFRTCPPMAFSKRLQNGERYTVRAQVNAIIDILVAKGMAAAPAPEKAEDWWAQAETFARDAKNPTLGVLFGREALRRRAGVVAWTVQVAEWCEAFTEASGGVHPVFDPAAAWEAVRALDPANTRALVGLATARLAAGDAREAATLASKLLETQPTLVLAHVTLGRALAELGDEAAASEAFARAILLDPTHAAARLARARVLLHLDRAADALDVLVQGRRLASMPLETNELQALAYEKLERRQDAHGQWKALADDSRTAPALRKRAAERVENIEKSLEFRLEAAARLASSKGTAEAVAAYAAVERDFPDCTEARLEQGVGYAILGRADDALAAFDRAIAADPRALKAYDHKAVALGRLKRFADALRTLAEGLAVLPDAPELLTRSGVMAALGGDARASLVWLRKAIAAGDTGDATLFLSDAEERNGDPEGARRTLEHWLAHAKDPAPRKVSSARRALHRLVHGRDIDPVAGERWLDKGLALANEGRHAEARTAYEESLALDPTRADTWHDLGAALAALGDDGAALAAYAEAEKLGSGAISQVGRARALARLLRIEEALSLLDQALSRSPDDLDALRTRARLRALTGRHADALSDLERARSNRPQDPDVREQLAATLEALGRTDDARHVRSAG